MPPTVLLFDIDGTLISSRGAGRRAMQAAFTARFGHADMLDFRFDGFTDQLIMRTAFDRLGAARPAPADEDAVVAALLALYVEALSREAPENFSAHAGVRDVLDAAAARPHLALGLGTGNIERGAAIKLGRVGLFERFAFGGFGDDHIERDRVLAAGAARGAARLGVARERCRVVVIGDTPRDIEAAHDIGAESLAVATGHFSLATLRAAGATHAFATLADPGVADALLDD